MGAKPFVFETDRLKLSDTLNQRIPKWISLVYSNVHNKAALDALQNAGCRQIYGNHDVYLAFDEWKFSNIATMDRLRNSPGFFQENLLWVEHGHRFDASNRDGYWLWIDLDHPPGPLVNTAVNYYPGLRLLGDKYDNSDSNLYQKNVPYATIWFCRPVAVNLKPAGLRLPPKFRIFCQGHTHSPVLLNVNVFWSKLTGKYDGTTMEEDLMKDQQMRERHARAGIRDQGGFEDMAIYIELYREASVKKDR